MDVIIIISIIIIYFIFFRAELQENSSLTLDFSSVLSALQAFKGTAKELEAEIQVYLLMLQEQVFLLLLSLLI